MVGCVHKVFLLCAVQCVKESLNDDHHRYLALALAHSDQKKNKLCYVPFHRISFAKIKLHKSHRNAATRYTHREKERERAT